MEEFKEKALILLDLLDSSLPAVNRLKVVNSLKIVFPNTQFSPENAGHSPRTAAGGYGVIHSEGFLWREAGHSQLCQLGGKV